MIVPVRMRERKKTAREVHPSLKRRTVRRQSVSEQFATESIGRVGELKLEYAKRDQQTIVSHSYFTTPWKFLPPIYLDDTGTAYTLLVNPSGGLVGGDRLSIDLNLEQGAQVLISAPSANRVYRSAGTLSEQSIDITVGPGAILEWLPEHTIPFAGSRFRQTLHAKLAPGATIVLWDAIASGRMARGERWAFTDLENEIRIMTASGGSLIERYVLDPASDLGGVGLAGEWDYVASLYVISDAISSEAWSRLESKAAAIMEKYPGHVLGGASTPAVPGIAIKLLTRTAPYLAEMLDTLWATVRQELWNLPPVSLRKY